MVPDPDGHLSEGVVLEAQIQGRLFGAPILRLDAEVVLTPARPDPIMVAPAAAPAALPAPPPPAARPAARPAPGSSLAQAQSLLDENAASLRELGQR